MVPITRVTAFLAGDPLVPVAIKSILDVCESKKLVDYAGVPIAIGLLEGYLLVKGVLRLPQSLYIAVFNVYAWKKEQSGILPTNSKHSINVNFRVCIQSITMALRCTSTVIVFAAKVSGSKAMNLRFSVVFVGAKVINSVINILNTNDEMKHNWKNKKHVFNIIGEGFEIVAVVLPIMYEWSFSQRSDPMFITAGNVMKIVASFIKTSVD
jgi:hypothetical protein